MRFHWIIFLAATLAKEMTTYIHLLARGVLGIALQKYGLIREPIWYPQRAIKT